MLGKMPERPDKSKYVVKVNRELLAEASVYKIFDSHLWKHFSWILQEVGDMECEGVMFKPPIGKNCGQSLMQQQPMSLLVDTIVGGNRQAENGGLSGLANPRNL